jgi:ABC-type molybdenum transport system ATPase subunit/photorepair protein PhrA
MPVSISARPTSPNPLVQVVASAMTIREHLQMFASIQGLSSSGHLAVDSALLAADISAENAKQLARNSSVGTLRKLQLAIALMGGPRVLLLDEPTFGEGLVTVMSSDSSVKAGTCDQGADELSREIRKDFGDLTSVAGLRTASSNQGANMGT